MSVIESVHSNGDLLPSMIIFKGKVHMEKWYKDGSIIRDSHIATSSNGWTDNELDYLWLAQLFQPATCHTVGARRLLILDEHESHISWAFIRHCWDHNIIPLCLPAHSTHLLQPLDVGLFSPLSKAYGKLIDNMVRFSQSKLTIAETTPAHTHEQTRNRSTEHASKKRIRTSARIVTMAEVEERRKRGRRGQK